MANIKSAKKRIKLTAVETERNRVRKSVMRTYVRKVNDSITSGEKADIKILLNKAISVIYKTAQKKVIHKNTAARKISRLNARVKASV